MDFEFRWVDHSTAESSAEAKSGEPPNKRTYRNPTADMAIANVERERRRRERVWKKERAREEARKRNPHNTQVWRSVKADVNNKGKDDA